MQIFVTIKQAGGRRDLLIKRDITIRDGIMTLGELLDEIVMMSVQIYNQKPPDPDIVNFLTHEVIENQAKTGKVGFLRRVNQEKAKVEDAVHNTRQSFEDGLFRVFLDGQEITALTQGINLKSGAELIFVRMTMLAGRLW